jgi:cytochrome c biogenesis protein CcmG/thiol:disulfide interchange protein DsbE
MKTVAAAAWIATLLAAALPARAGEAAQLDMPTLDGTQFRLEDARGKVVLVHFWASWCATCKEEMGALEAYQRGHASQGLVVISPSLDRARDMAEVHKTMHAFGLPVGLAKQATRNSFGLPAILPTTFVVDGNGGVVATMRPDALPVNAENLAKVVDPLLAGAKQGP